MVDMIMVMVVRYWWCGGHDGGSGGEVLVMRWT